MNFLPGWFPAGAAGRRLPFSLEYINELVNFNTTNNTFNGVSFGDVPPAGEKRYIVVATQNMNASDARTVNSVTIGGVAATEIIGRDATNTPGGVWIAEVPTGTSGTILITMSGDTDVVYAAVARVMNPENPLGSDAAALEHTSAVIDLSLNIPPGGAALAVTASQNASTTTWVGLSERDDRDVATDEYVSAAASELIAAGGSPHTITATNADGTPSRFAGVSVAWGPDTRTH